MSRSDHDPSPLDDAARAGWLSYVGGMTQDQIAVELGVSRQRAQRLVSRAMAEGLIRVRLDHRIGACLRLEAELTRRFALMECRVAPALAPGADPAHGIAGVAAEVFERVLARPEPQVIAVGTGRALRGMADELQPQPCIRHRIVSLIGNIAPDGSASFFDVLMRIADKLQAPHYPMPVPVISDSAEERASFYRLRPVRAVVDLAQRADATFVGVGQMGDDAPLYKDGFITLDELRDLQRQGASGEVAGNIYDASGRYLETELIGRMGGVRIAPASDRPVVGIAAGPTKVAAIRAALTGRIINALVTDETTAQALLA
ncbi:sugar-binding transcriptional regulator [Frigidibacter oleivorans]|uniref:sugar-binding transcriptional regulator n=1 Tax=Frigidibacter oleivorans TaxID=2487129 RepID=UPI000F8E90DB|nr:sugar-binding transcriptional regulator [Frigidibacter oleivorans]